MTSGDPQDPTFEHLSAYLDGECSARRRLEIEIWLSTRPEERARLEALRAFERGLREEARRGLDPEPPAEMEAAVRKAALG